MADVHARVHADEIATPQQALEVVGPQAGDVAQLAPGDHVVLVTEQS